MPKMSSCQLSSQEGTAFKPVSPEEVVETAERELLPLFEGISKAGGGPVVLTKNQADAFVNFFKGQIQHAYSWRMAVDDGDNPPKW